MDTSNKDNTPRHEAPAEGGPVFHMNLLSHEDNEAWLESARRVAAKHEAPAEGVGETRDRLIEVLKRMDDGVYASLNDQADAVISALILQPKDPAEVGAEVASAARALLDACYKADVNSDLSDFVDGMLLTRLDKALRARSSAPEAREDAQPFAWAYRLNFPDENTAWDWEAAKEKMTEAKFGQHGGILETMPLYTHPAAPSADKLRIAVEALDTITDLSVNLRQGGPDSSDLNDLSDALNTAVDVAHEALAALQAEGA